MFVLFKRIILAALTCRLVSGTWDAILRTSLSEKQIALVQLQTQKLSGTTNVQLGDGRSVTESTLDIHTCGDITHAGTNGVIQYVVDGNTNWASLDIVGRDDHQTNQWDNYTVPKIASSISLKNLGSDGWCLDQIVVDGIPITTRLPMWLDNPCVAPVADGIECNTEWTWDVPTDSTCLVSDDPHVIGFDGASLSLSGALLSAEGSTPLTKVWLVKSSNIKVQGQLMGEGPLLASIAIGGPFLEGRRLVIPSYSSNVSWDDGKALTTQQENEFAVPGLITAKQVKTSLGIRINAELPRGMRLTVMRFEHHITAAISMRMREDGQEGLCGNFNGAAFDDALDLGSRSSDLMVPIIESLFPPAY